MVTMAQSATKFSVLEPARSDKANLSLILAGNGLIPYWGGEFSPLILYRFLDWLSGGFSGYSGLLPAVLGKGPFTCTFKILIHIIIEG